MKHLLFLLAVLIFAPLASAQTCTVTGQVTSWSITTGSAPIANAKVSVLQIKKSGVLLRFVPQSTVTDASGNFSLALPVEATVWLSIPANGFGGANGVAIPVPSAAQCAGGTVALSTLPAVLNATAGITPVVVVNGGGGGATWGGITGTLSGQTDLQAALNAKQASDADLTAIAGLSPTNDDVIQRISGAWVNRSMAQLKTSLALVKGDVGLGNVDNTSDASKPISTLTQAALDLKAASSHNHAATDINSGTLPDARFPATLPALSGANLTALNASNLASGTVPLARLSGITTAELSGTAGITSAQLAGSIAISKLAITGTPDGSKFLRDDGSWQAASGGGGGAWSALTDPTGNLSLAMGTNLTTLTWPTGTSTSNLFNLTTANSSNGTGYLLNVATGTSSTVNPFRVAAVGVDRITVTAAGVVTVGGNAVGTHLRVLGTASGNFSRIAMGGGWLFDSRGAVTSGDPLWFSRGSNSLFVFTTTGQLGVGDNVTPSSTEQMAVKSATSSVVTAVFSTAASPSAPIAKFQNSTTDKFTINNDGTILQAGIAFSALGSTNGTIVYITDGAVTSGADNTCTSGGTGALGVRLNGVWRCFVAQN